MKKISFFTAVFAAFFTATVSADDYGEFTGDVKYACEALLCLSSGTRPGECSPSLAKYFGIKKKKMSDTIKARLDFLNLCPASQDSQEMKNLTVAIANGAGRCDAEYLNETLREVWYIRENAVCQDTNSRSSLICKNRQWQVTERSRSRLTCPDYDGRNTISNQTCRISTITVIGEQKPSYCVAYEGAEYTDKDTLGTVYEGDKFNGGKWVDKNKYQ